MAMYAPALYVALNSLDLLGSIVIAVLRYTSTCTRPRWQAGLTAVSFHQLCSFTVLHSLHVILKYLHNKLRSYDNSFPRCLLSCIAYHMWILLVSKRVYSISIFGSIFRLLMISGAVLPDDVAQDGDEATEILFQKVQSIMSSTS